MNRLAVTYFLGMLTTILLLSSCGYTTGSLLPSEYRTIRIEPFKNNVTFVGEGSRAAYIPLLETKVRQSIMDRFQLDGRLRLIDSDRADLILQGELIGLEREELRLTDNRDVQEYRIRVTVGLTMFDATKEEMMWKETSFSGEATYFTSGSQATSESAAVQVALTDLSRRIVERTVENW